MAQRGIREYHGKKMMAKYWSEYFKNLEKYDAKVVLVDPETSMEDLIKQNSWLTKEKLVVKPDQLIGKRGKNNIILLNATLEEAESWINNHMNKDVTIGKVTGKLTHFLVEPFVPHERNKEYYVAITSNREGDAIHFSTHGGVDIEEVWDSVETMQVSILSSINDIRIKENLGKDLPEKDRNKVTEFIEGLFKFYRDLGYAYLELNPIIVTKASIMPLDMAARLDDTAQFVCGDRWGGIYFPAPFGRKLTKEEKLIKELDGRSGASLKLTVLNPKGRVWTLVAGGGASVVYTDTVVDLGFQDELANYGEYSGNPSTDETYIYAKTILDLMTREKNDKGKILLIGGGIANFTDVAKTFTGIVKALNEYRQKLAENNVIIYVRRGGPNYQQGLENMKDLGKTLGLPIEVFGPELHMTAIVSMGLAEKENK